jgi:hypothetical protein
VVATGRGSETLAADVVPRNWGCAAECRQRCRTNSKLASDYAVLYIDRQPAAGAVRMSCIRVRFGRGSRGCGSRLVTGW